MGGQRVQHEWSTRHPRGSAGRRCNISDVVIPFRRHAAQDTGLRPRPTRAPVANSEAIAGQTVRCQSTEPASPSNPITTHALYETLFRGHFPPTTPLLGSREEGRSKSRHSTARREKELTERGTGSSHLEISVSVSAARENPVPTFPRVTRGTSTGSVGVGFSISKTNQFQKSRSDLPSALPKGPDSERRIGEYRDDGSRISINENISNSEIAYRSNQHVTDATGSG